MSTQRQVHSFYKADDSGGTESARCPFCHTVTIGRYVEGGQGLTVEQTCEHGMGFVAGAHGAPSVIFEGDPKIEGLEQ